MQRSLSLVQRNAKIDKMTKITKYAQVIVDIPALELNMKTFSYSIPEELEDKIAIGSPVSVPFGRQDPVFGYVVGFTSYISEDIKVKPIFELLDDDTLFDLKYLEFIEWVANYYMCNLVTALSSAIPSGLWSTNTRLVKFTSTFDKNDLKTLNIVEQKICQILLASKKGSFSPTTISYKAKIPRHKLYTTLRSMKAKSIITIENSINANKAKPKLVEFVELVNKTTSNNRYEEILKVLSHSENGIIETSKLLKLAKTTRPTLKKLCDSGNIRFKDVQIYRNPLERYYSVKDDEKYSLTSHQETALSYIYKVLDQEVDPEPILLYGVTGSGKTEVYFHAIAKILGQGKSVIFLVPEITLTSQISSRMIARFGHEVVGIWHSSLSMGERLDIWKKIRSGEIKIILGARSAIFSPAQNLGLIILDEEHESSYKQDTPSPRYHARDVALERAKRFGAKIILGSATPDINTYYRAKNLNRIVNLPFRVQQRPMANIVVVDMKEELERGNKTIFSRVLSYELQERLKKNEQSILLINRRGYTTYVFCRSCGFVATCKHCSIPLIYHSNLKQLRCHYCNFKQDNYEQCPECSSAYIKHYGTGTQRVEEDVIKKFPGAKVLRLDSDITTQKNAHYEIIEKFSKGKADILIGTQMVAKGLDMPGVTLVGVLFSDSAFTFPDYRSMERGFQLLTQVAGRAGRGSTPGKVVFQCYSLAHFPIACAQKQDFVSFYSFEIFEREKYNYPPFSQLVRILITSEEQTTALTEALKLHQYLSSNFADLSEKIEILGPSECIISKIQNKYRVQILIKNLISTHGHNLIIQNLKKYNYNDVKISVDVDPLNML